MSFERGWQALQLEMPDTIPHTEYCSHPRLVQAVTGMHPGDNPEAWKRFYELTGYDLLWSVHDGPAWKGRVTNMGHAEFQEGGTDFDNHVQCPFKTPEDVLSFDPVAEYGLPDIDERAAFFEKGWQASQDAHPMLVFTGGYYKTIFSACIQAFGWEMFLTAAPMDYERFDRVLEGFFQISLANYRAWAKTSAPVFISHDDIVWSHGPVFHPDWYRRYIFPRYKTLWGVLKDAGKKVLFCSDANFDVFIDDVAEAGADGFIIEPLTQLEPLVEKYGQSKVIIGNVDTRVLTFGTREDVRCEVERCIALGKGCPGYFLAVGNHIPSNVPVDNALYYFDLIRDRRRD